MLLVQRSRLVLAPKGVCMHPLGTHPPRCASLGVYDLSQMCIQGVLA